jgi:glutamine synthetase
VNSYKRLIAGGEAPSYISWGHNNRSAMVRVPMYKPNKGQSTRIELRTIDAAANPYLAYAVVLAAGMKGLEEEYELPREAEDDVWSLTERERKALGLKQLPKSLYDAINIAEDSELLAETLGEHVYDFFLRNKRAEWEEYRGQVSAFERDRMLPVI